MTGRLGGSQGELGVTRPRPGVGDRLRRWFGGGWRNRALPGEYAAILSRDVPLYGRLDEADQRELRQHLQVFLRRKTFEGCAGQMITDEVRITIGAQACILLLHRQTGYYPRLRSILVYPHAYVAWHRERGAGGVVSDEVQQRAGESWSRGAVVLAWDEVRRGAAGVRDGRNVVLHEFAHQLDTEDDSRADGAVALPQRAMYGEWAAVMRREYAELQQQVGLGRPTVLDAYGATSPAEFFAVATECFFERPAALMEAHPELYGELKLYYRQDPVRWASSGTAPLGVE